MARRCKGRVSGFYRNLFFDEQVRDLGDDALEVLSGPNVYEVERLIEKRLKAKVIHGGLTHALTESFISLNRNL